MTKQIVTLTCIFIIYIQNIHSYHQQFIQFKYIGFRDLNKYLISKFKKRVVRDLIAARNTPVFNRTTDLFTKYDEQHYSN